MNHVLALRDQDKEHSWRTDEQKSLASSGMFDSMSYEAKQRKAVACQTTSMPAQIASSLELQIAARLFQLPLP